MSASAKHAELAEEAAAQQALASQCQPIDTEDANKDAKGDKPAKYTRLGRSEEAQIVRLHRDGLTQAQIARAVGRAQSTVSEVLSEFASTVDLAEAKLEAEALGDVHAYVRLRDTADPETQLAALTMGWKRRGWLPKETSGNTAVQVNVGLPGNADPIQDAEYG